MEVIRWRNKQKMMADGTDGGEQLNRRRQSKEIIRVIDNHENELIIQSTGKLKW